ncbi:MAG TPA: response regulator, partial [Ktedonobacterales bacterium]|nr:response regulator [Ktedonobacterales bacterium]
DKQVEFARTIHAAGTDLLNLISDILDLSKIESGTVSVEADSIVVSKLLDEVARPFRHEAETRRLAFETRIDTHASRAIVTDSKRLQQILKNLLSNAFKFTEQGGVRLNIATASAGWSADHPTLKSAASVIAFEVSDTGIGIPAEKQRLIFEAFQQADASTSRRFGGTGLGLAISRELANLLGGEIKLRSTPGKGSSFTLYLPQTYIGPAVGAGAPANIGALDATVEEPALEAPTALAVDRAAVVESPDDSDILTSGDAVLLVVEDDPYYRQVLMDLARDRGFKAIVASTGHEALELARRYHPSAISLDVYLPDMLGWTVLSQLKQDPSTRHIPVQIVTMDENRQHGLSRGAFAFMTKPVSADQLDSALSRIKEFAANTQRRLLVVEDNPAERLSVSTLLSHDDIAIDTVSRGDEALAALAANTYDCVVLDLSLPDMTGFEVLERIRDDNTLHNLPVVVFTGKALTLEEDQRLQILARSVVV